MLLLAAVDAGRDQRAIYVGNDAPVELSRTSSRIAAGMPSNADPNVRVKV